jgi:hypothetical protein
MFYLNVSICMVTMNFITIGGRRLYLLHSSHTCQNKIQISTQFQLSIHSLYTFLVPQ